MADNLIRWKRGDYVKLSKAVASFNRKINQLDVDEAKYLPDLKDYKELKQNIKSRKELNRIVKSLRRFNIEGAEALVELPSGELVSKWEYREIKLSRNRALKRLEQEKLNIEAGKKWVGMGDERIDQIESTISSIKNLENAPSYLFNLKVDRIQKLGSYDYELNKASEYRENYMKALEEMSTYEGYDLLKDKLESIKNPIQFYEYVQKSQTLKDLFLYYKDKATAQTYGGFASNQDAFNYTLEELELVD